MITLHQLRLPTVHENVFITLSFVGKTTRCAALNGTPSKGSIFDRPISCALAAVNEFCEIQADPQEPILWVGTAAFYLRPEDVAQVAEFLGIPVPAAKEVE